VCLGNLVAQVLATGTTRSASTSGPAWPLRAVVSAKAAEVVRDIVQALGGQTVLLVRTRSLTWPGVNGVEPEPIACLESAKELEQAARMVQLEYIRLEGCLADGMSRCTDSIVSVAFTGDARVAR